MARNGRVKLRYHRNYEGIGAPTRDRIQRTLGMKGGMMRPLAEKMNPACAVAYHDGEPTGWAALFEPGRYCENRWSSKAVQIYVAKEWRRQGIGAALLKKLADGAKLWDGPTVTYWRANSKAVRKCLAAAGFESE